MGSLIRQQYTKLDPKTGKRVTHQSRKWYCLYKRGDKWLRVPAYTDKVASQQMLSRLEREAAREAEGIFDHLSCHATRPILEHVAEFRQNLEDRGNTADYVQTTDQRVKWIIEETGIERIGEITSSRVEKALAKLVKEGASTASRNHYLRAIKMFTAWLVDDRRAADDPIKGMSAKSVEQDRRLVRRPLTRDELSALLTSTIEGPERGEMSGPDRAALYLLAAYTGYRRNELGSVTPKSFTFGEAASVAVKARTSKRRKAEVIPLRSDVAIFFANLVEGRSRDEPLFPVTDAKTADLIRADLRAARGAWLESFPEKQRNTAEESDFLAAVDADGRKVDFHSLRGTFITRLSESGVLPKMVQTLARHSDIRLTMQTYTHLERSDQQAAIEALPSLPASQGLHNSLHKNLSLPGTESVPGVSDCHSNRNKKRSKNPVIPRKKR